MKNEKIDFNDKMLLASASAVVFAALEDELIFEQTLQGVPTVSAYNLEGLTPLQAATKKGLVKTVRMLLKKGADVHQRSLLRAEHVLHIAAREGQLEILKLLLKNAREKTASDAKQQMGGHSAGHHDPVNITDIEGRTPLHCAAFAGHQPIVEYLLDEKANLHAIHSEKFSALGSAALSGHTKLVRFLLQKKIQDGSNTALHCAAIQGHIAVMEVLRDHGKVNLNALNDDKNAALHLAVVANQELAVRWLLENRAQINVINKDGFTPLHLVAKMGHREIVSLLLAADADKSFFTFGKYFALHNAAFGGHTEIVRLLLAQFDGAKDGDAK